MIRSIRHKGLKRLHQVDDPRGVIADHAEKLRDILARVTPPVRPPIWICLAFDCTLSRESSEVFGP